MKRWRWLPAAILLAFTACDEKDDQPVSPHSSSAASAPASPADAVYSARASDDGALTKRMKAFADAPAPGGDETAAARGAQFFDGASLRNAGFAVPGGDSAVYAGSGGGSRSASAGLGANSSANARKSAAISVPPPDAAVFPADGAAQAQGAGKVLAEFDAFQRRMFAAAAPILSRAGWGAAKRKGTPVAMTPTHVTVHHTEGAQTMTEEATAAEVRNIQQYHMAGRAAEGKDVWDDIGYHFLIDGAGRVVEGRPAETLGAHARNANANNIGIAVMGNFEKIKPTAEQVESLTRLVSFLALKYGENPTADGFLEGHRHYDNTDCPGRNMMAILGAIRAKIGAETIALAERLKIARPGEFVPVMTDA